MRYLGVRAGRRRADGHWLHREPYKSINFPQVRSLSLGLALAQGGGVRVRGVGWAVCACVCVWVWVDGREGELVTGGRRCRRRERWA